MDSKIFDTLLEPVFILNERKEVLYCNEPASLICDSSPRKLARSKTPLDQVFQFAAPLEYIHSLAQVVDATPYQEIAFKIGDDKTGKVQITFQPFSEIDGQKTWIAFFRDVTLEETLQRKYRAELEQKEDVILDLQKAQAELEKYSKNLEQMVEERTAQIKKLNQMMAALLDSLGQGFFIFDKSGACLEIFSKACEATVECKPYGKKIWEVLGLPERQVVGFQKWMTTVFAEMLPFEDLVPLAPQVFNHSQGKNIKLEYYPLRPKDQTGMDGVVVVATDITALVEAQREAEIEGAHAKMIVSLILHKRHLVNFMKESTALIEELKNEFKKEESASTDGLFRILHTIKGGAASFSIKPLADQAHESESLLTNWKADKTSQNFQNLKITALGIEEQFHQFSIENEGILGSADKLKSRWIELPADKLYQFQSKLPTPQLSAEFLVEFLMEPIGEHFKQYGEIVQNIAEREMKSVDPVEFHNAEIPILPEHYSHLFSTFIHQFRNAVDHGIEPQGKRQETGKPLAGKIDVCFSLKEENGARWLWLEVKDDGGGIDPAKIRSLLTAKGIDVRRENDEQVIQHIFDSQFSTKEAVTETSGRGVGMDAILHAAQKLGGTAWVKSELGKGTSLYVKVPYLVTLQALSQSTQAA